MMEHTSTNGESTSQHVIKNLESDGETLVLKKSRRKSKAKKTLILDLTCLRTSAISKDLLFRNIHGLHDSIPKHITTFDEKYVLRCLESIRNCALRAAAWNFTLNMDNLSNLEVMKSSNNMARLPISYPLVGKTEVIINSSGDWTIGTLTGSQTMINILKSPLLKQFESFDYGVNVGKTDLLDFVDSLQESNSTSSHKLQRELKFLEHNYLSAPVHIRNDSISSTNSSCSDQSSSSANCESFQGMLKCTWKNGLPHYVLTVDDKREIYVTNLSKVESLDGKGLNYVYTFHSTSNGNKECDIHELELESIAKMFVSTSATFSSDDNLEIKETRFILSVASDDQTKKTVNSTGALRKKSRLTRKVVDIFKSTHSHKQRPISSQLTASDLYEDTHNHFLDLAPNLEMAAIIVKDVCQIRKEPEIGGWGLRFLKRPSLETSICSRNTGECSTSMDIIIPVGFHGGPRTRVGGPSGLTERWISGGRCDCGGWDIGCPLTILKTRADNYGECKSIDLFMQGSKQNAPVMKLVNFHEGLYYIHFQSTLSSLQSLAIAAAIIHSNSPVLLSKVYRS